MVIPMITRKQIDELIRDCDPYLPPDQDATTREQCALDERRQREQEARGHSHSSQPIVAHSTRYCEHTEELLQDQRATVQKMIERECEIIFEALAERIVDLQRDMEAHAVRAIDIAVKRAVRNLRTEFIRDKQLTERLHKQLRQQNIERVADLRRELTEAVAKLRGEIGGRLEFLEPKISKLECELRQRIEAINAEVDETQKPMRKGLAAPPIEKAKSRPEYSQPPDSASQNIWSFRTAERCESDCAPAGPDL